MLTRIFLALFFVGCAYAPASAIAAENSSAARSAPVAVGETAPDFTLEDQDGRKRALSAERGKRPVVLVFYRGHW
jgi:cytochrome oxidase Cu insertion factor (SCO1/SenC/PrrC family)